MIAGLASSLPRTLTRGLTAQGVPFSVATQVSHLPPVSTMFAALLGYNPVQNLLTPPACCARLPAHNVAVLTGRQFFPNLISAPFHHGLVIVSPPPHHAASGAMVSLLRGKQFYYDDKAAVLPHALSSSAGDSPAVADDSRAVAGRDGASRAVAAGRRLSPVPRYEYRCRACGDTFELTRPMTESSAPCTCPQGHDDTVKLLSRVSVSVWPRAGPFGPGGGSAVLGVLGRRLLRRSVRLRLARYRFASLPHASCDARSLLHLAQLPAFSPDWP